MKLMGFVVPAAVRVATAPALLMVACGAVLEQDALLAQDLVHYRFDGGCGSEAIGFAPGSPRGQIATTSAGGISGARVPGAFGTALSGSTPGLDSTRVDTGWMPDTPSGDFSIAMWLRNHAGNPATIPFGYVFGATGAQLRLYIGSSGRLQLDGFPANTLTATDLTSRLNSGWVHVACVVDSGAFEATWYIDGVPEQPDPFGVPVWVAGTDFTIGARDTAGAFPSPLDIDEFLWREGALLPSEVQALAAGPRAAIGSYTSGTATPCGAAGALTLDATGGEPALGNSAFALRVTPASNSLSVLVVGLDRCQIQGQSSPPGPPLPLDAGALLAEFAGCQLLAEPLVLQASVGSGSSTTPLPIPAALTGFPTVYAQALSLDLSTLQASNTLGLAVATGL
ncbi:MAG: LamG-like jellyroll fold domain-containing protein [Planctomycetota bacterium]